MFHICLHCLFTGRCIGESDNMWLTWLI